MNQDPIAASRTQDVPLQLSLPLRYDDARDPSTEQDHPELFERDGQIAAPVAQ
jgi:hypothetical protein